MGGRDLRDGVMLEDIVGVLTCIPCAVHFNCYEMLWKSTFMCAGYMYM